MKPSFFWSMRLANQQRNCEKNYQKFRPAASDIQRVWEREKSTQVDELSKYKMRPTAEGKGEDLSLRLITPLIACQVLT